MTSTSGRIARCSHVPSKTWRSWEVLPDQLFSSAQNDGDRQVPFGFLDRQDQIHQGPRSIPSTNLAGVLVGRSQRPSGIDEATGFVGFVRKAINGQEGISPWWLMGPRRSAGEPAGLVQWFARALPRRTVLSKARCRPPLMLGVSYHRIGAPAYLSPSASRCFADMTAGTRIVSPMPGAAASMITLWSARTCSVNRRQSVRLKRHITANKPSNRML
jgi:hypothetical protein